LSGWEDTEEIMQQQSVVCVPEAFEFQSDECGNYPVPDFSLCPPHRVEAEVSRTLREAPGVHVESLSVHRTDGDHICLHGVIELDDPSVDVESIIQRALSIDQVINRMVVKYGPSAVCQVTDLDQSFMWG
jgi:hypothetical protein